MTSIAQTKTGSALLTKVIAHRGAWKNNNFPENSIAALKAAINDGFYGSEMDVHMTSDGFLVVNHDPHFHGVDIQNSTLAELRKFKLSDGEELPLLSDFLKIIAGQNKVRLILEIKTSERGPEWGLQTVKKVTEEVSKYHAASRVTYISFGFDICKEILRYVPKARVQYLNGDKKPGEIKAAGLSGIDYHYSVFQRHPEYLGQCKELGVISNAWTVNDSVTMDWLIAQGINMLTTNEPEVAVQRVKNSPEAEGYHLVWSDEFLHDGLPDKKKWNYEVGDNGWGNRELEYYTHADTNNAIVKNGVLNIIARKEKMGKSDFTSARLTTKGIADWTYGRVEARIKLPKGVGLWPAFWMLGSNVEKAGWPDCGEIDIMEHVGYEPDSIYGTIHCGAFNSIKRNQKGGRLKVSNLYDDFNIYAIEWTPANIRFFVNDIPFFEFSNLHKTSAEWPFDKPAFIILNLAVGGSWGGKEGVDEKIFPATYQVDYVRVFQKGSK